MWDVCLMGKKKRVILGPYQGKRDEIVSCSMQLLFDENFLASIKRLLGTELRRNQY